ncbi:LysR family transcriptional regulator [Kaistia nematophila]|uniref:LysR family transcriptional regulator n=1 Tax=Kaistia nematophila TaxID=2994654 RepID=A0A9X3IM62_9HYPH|nr:LysR family transcriptional regulator [Kaistia nematophila]MCX5571429.1 LysR family transcriptional regulator [Kaistia nematophila]
MTLDQLRIFIAVAEREHLTRAAEALRLTPSAVSSAIHALEARYDARLFDRVGRRIELTEAGRVFLVEARATIARAQAAELALAELGGLLRGTLEVQASQTIASYWLPSALVRFRAAYPSLGIHLQIGNTETVRHAVHEGLAEIGFIEGEIDDPALATRAVGEDRLILVTTPGHALARAATVGPEEIAATRWVMRERGSGTRSVFEAALTARGIQPETLQVDMELPSNEAVRAAVETGEHATVVSELVASPHIEAGKLARVAFEMTPRAFSMVWHKERYRSKAARALETLLSEPTNG